MTVQGLVPASGPPGPTPRPANALERYAESPGFVHEIWRAFREQRRVIAIVLAAEAALLAAYVLAFRSPAQFEARAELLVEHEIWQPLGKAPGGTGPEASYYDSQFRILRSRALARKTLTVLAKPMLQGNVSSRPAAPPAPTIEASAVDGFLRALTVTQLPESRVIELRFRSEDPDYSARALNTHAQSYIDATIEEKRSIALEASDWLRRQLVEQRQRVQKGEAELREYERRTGVADGRQVVSTQRMSELSSAVTRARSQRIAKESTLQQVEEARRAGRTLNEMAALVPTAVGQQLSLELAMLQRQENDMRGHYGERHPERIKVREAIAFTQSRLQAEIGNAIEVMAREVEATRQEELRLTGSLTAQNAEAASLSRRMGDSETLRRTLAADRGLLERLQQGLGELNVSGDSGLTNIRILDSAEAPRAPLADPVWKQVGLGCSLALLLALGVGWSRYLLDERVRSPEDVKAHLGLPYLGTVPEIADSGLGSYLASGTVAPAMFREAMRELRTHVLCTPSGQDARILLVTSAGTAEGKTLVATNLAAGLAKVGQRVLLIDLDLRRPSVHHAFDVSLQPGLVELLSGSVKAADAMRRANLPDLWLLTAGRALISPGDLFGSGAFKRLMQSLPESFDRIVIDSPPVMACADASAIAHEQVGIMFVVGADRTVRRVAQAALDRLEAVGARFVGVVLNRVDLSQSGSAYHPYDDASQAGYALPARASAQFSATGMIRRVGVNFLRRRRPAASDRGSV